MNTILAMIGTALLVALYFLPLLVAAARTNRRPDSGVNVGPIAVVNTLLGWTGIGWIVALAMAMTSRRAATSV